MASSKLAQMRLTAVECLTRSTGPMQLSPKFLQNVLLLQSPEEVTSFVEACGFVFNKRYQRKPQE
jgi:hypothetical protein